jgi:hypothetical protein
MFLLNQHFTGATLISTVTAAASAAVNAAAAAVVTPRLRWT